MPARLRPPSSPLFKLSPLVPPPVPPPPNPLPRLPPNDNPEPAERGMPMDGLDLNHLHLDLIMKIRHFTAILDRDKDMPV